MALEAQIVVRYVLNLEGSWLSLEGLAIEACARPKRLVLYLGGSWLDLGGWFILLA